MNNYFTITDAYGIIRRNIQTNNLTEMINISNLQYGIYSVCVIKGSDIDIKPLQIVHP